MSQFLNKLFFHTWRYSIISVITFLPTNKVYTFLQYKYEVKSIIYMNLKNNYYAIYSHLSKRKTNRYE